MCGLESKSVRSVQAGCGSAVYGYSGVDSDESGFYGDVA